MAGFSRLRRLALKAGISDRRLWSLTGGLMIQTSIFQFNSLLELLSGQNYCYSQAEQDTPGGFLARVLQPHRFL